MGFLEGFYIPKPEELINNTFQRARMRAEEVQEKDKNKYIVEKEKTRIKVACEYSTKILKKICNEFPSIDKLNPLYKALLENSLNVLELKKALSHINASARTINELKMQALAKTTKANEMRIGSIRNEFYGRLNSVIKKLKTSFEIVKNAMIIISDIPTIRNLPAIIVVGCPNAGKSTFLKAVTNAKVEIKSYPFTTKRLQVGNVEINYLKFQLLDSPGILDRPEEKQNKIEKQTGIALRTIANSVVFIIDVSQELLPQKNIVKNILKGEKEKPFFLIFNKTDIINEEELEKYITEFKKGLKIKEEDIFKTNMNILSAETIDTMKNKIYKQNKDWYRKSEHA